MRQHIKTITLVMIKSSMKQKRKHYNGWPLVIEIGGSPEWLIWACGKEEIPMEAEHGILEPT